MKKISAFIILAGLFSLYAGADNGMNIQGDRNIPLDLYLVIDSSSAFGSSMEAAIAWINDEIIGNILLEGDGLVIWSAGDQGSIIFSGTISSTDTSVDSDLRNRLSALQSDSARADFVSPLREISARVSQTQVSQTQVSQTMTRLELTMLVFSSAVVLEPALRADTRNFLRWSRTLRYEGWQVIMTAGDIGPRVQQASRAYMNTLQ